MVIGKILYQFTLTMFNMQTIAFTFLFVVLLNNLLVSAAVIRVPAESDADNVDQVNRINKLLEDISTVRKFLSISKGGFNNDINDAFNAEAFAAAQKSPKMKTGKSVSIASGGFNNGINLAFDAEAAKAAKKSPTLNSNPPKVDTRSSSGEVDSEESTLNSSQLEVATQLEKNEHDIGEVGPQYAEHYLLYQTEDCLKKIAELYGVDVETLKKLRLPMLVNN